MMWYSCSSEEGPGSQGNDNYLKSIYRHPSQSEVSHSGALKTRLRIVQYKTSVCIASQAMASDSVVIRSLG